MNIGEKIYKLRKEKNMSQEELGNELNVSRQTISKWELGESCPDFDKILPICEIFNISTEELLKDKPGETIEEKEQRIEAEEKQEKKADVIKALLISISIFLYFIAIVAVILLDEVAKLNDGIVGCTFIGIAGLSTALLVFTLLSRRTIKSKEDIDKEVEAKQRRKKNELMDLIIGMFMLIVTVIYLLISFITMAWYITWIIWIVAAIGVEIIKLVFYIKEGASNEE